jgi:choline dehydrogenase-like flavoprotein
MTRPPARPGLPVTEDYNGAQQDGFGRMQMTIEHGRRCSGAVAYLRPALSRRNLTVEIKALVTASAVRRCRVSVGVEYIRHGEKTVVRAEREVILSGGSINSPQLLMLSGIGDPDELGAHGIPVRVPLSGVGKNLQDHVAALVTYARRQAARSSTTCGSTAGLEHCPRLRVRHRLRNQPAGVGHRIPQERFRASRFPTSSFSSSPRPCSRRALICLRSRSLFPTGFACRLVVLRPESRGQIRLASADPRAAPRIEQNLLATDRDWNSIRAGIRLLRELSHHPRCSRSSRRRSGPVRPRLGRGHRRAHPARPRSRAIIRPAPVAWGRTRWRSSIRSCVCAGRKVFASSTRRSFPIWSAATSMPLW